MLVTLEGRMGSGKSLSAVALAYTEFIKREILISALEFVMKDTEWSKAILSLVESYKISERVAEGSLQEALSIYEVEGEEAYRGRKKVVCNTHLNFPYTHLDPKYFLEHLEDEEMEDCILIYDEPAQAGLDSRSTATKYNKLMSYFMGQSRKRGVDVYFCLLHIDMIEKRIRRWIDIRGTCRFNKGPIEKDKPIPKRQYNWATIRLRDMRNGNGRRIRIYGPAFWGLYDTMERLPFLPKQVAVEL